MICSHFESPDGKIVKNLHFSKIGYIFDTGPHVIPIRGGTGRDGTGLDGTGRDWTGRDWTGRDGTGKSAKLRKCNIPILQYFNISIFQYFNV